MKSRTSLYIRDYDKCVLCYKCVEACGDDAQHTFAIAVQGAASAPASPPSSMSRSRFGMRVLRQLHRRCAPPARSSSRLNSICGEAGEWRPEEQSVTTHGLLLLRRWLQPRTARQDNTIVKVHVAADHSVTNGHLCIKGRFGWTYVQPTIERR